MQKTLPLDSDIADICTALHAIAQRHVPQSCFTDVTELVQLTRLMRALDIPVTVAAKIQAEHSAYSPSVVKHTPEYRLLRARFLAALGTIADMGARKIRKNKSEYHAGVQEGLRRASKVAIMFLNDIDNNTIDERLDAHGKYTDAAPKTKPISSLVR